jgi:hypothetical protein
VIRDVQRASVSVWWPTIACGFAASAGATESRLITDGRSEKTQSSLSEPVLPAFEPRINPWMCLVALQLRGLVLVSVARLAAQSTVTLTETR